MDSVWLNLCLLLYVWSAHPEKPEPTFFKQKDDYQRTIKRVLHKLGHLDRFIKNVEANPNAPQVIQSIAEAVVWAFTPEGMDFWLLLDYTFAKEKVRYTINEPKKYQGDDDSRAE